MKMKSFICTICALFLLVFALEAKGSSEVLIGIVNFGKCISESKYGQEEQKAFEETQNKIRTLMSDREKELSNLAGKLEDPEFLDTLSPEAEEEMKAKFQTLSEEYNFYQNQSMQMLQQANMKMLQVMKNYIEIAAQKVSREKNVLYILPQDLCIVHPASADMTAPIVKELDKNFEKGKDGKIATSPKKEDEKVATSQEKKQPSQKS